MGTIGPKANPKPIIFHVDSDTSIPYRLAETDILVVGTISATNYQNLSLTAVGGVTSIEQLAGTGIFETTSHAVTTYLTQATAATTYVTQTYANANLVQNSDLNEYVYLGPLTATVTDGDILYYDNAEWKKLSIGANGQILTVDTGLPIWDDPCGTVTLPIQVNNGGTGSTTQTNNGVLYYNGTNITSQAGLTYNAGTTTFAAPTITTTNPIAVQYGGTNATSIENARTNLGLGPLATATSPLSVANGGTNFTGPYTTEGVLYFDGTRLQTDSGFTYKAGTDTATLGNLTLTNPLSVANGGTGRSTLAAGNFLIGNGTSLVTTTPTSTYETTANAAATYFNKSSDTLAVNRGGTGVTTQANNGILWYNGSQLTSNSSLKLGTALKLLAVCGVALPSKGLYLDDGTGGLNPTTPFKLTDVYDVDATGPSNGSLLSYDTGVNNWKSLATLPLANGGTGATTNTQARSNLGLGTFAVLNSLSLTGLSNVTATAPTNGQVLTYDTAINKWKPSTPTVGGSETWDTIFATAEETNDQTTLVNSTYLSCTVATGTTYSYDFNVLFYAYTTEGFDFKIDFPTATEHYWDIEYTRPGTGFGNKLCKAGNGTFSEQTGTVDVTGDGSVRIKGTLIVGTAGTLLFQFGVTTKDTDSVKIRKGSYLKCAVVN